MTENTKCLGKNWTKKELLNREKCALIMFIGKQYNIIFSVFLVDVKKNCKRICELEWTKEWIKLNMFYIETG